MGSSTSPVEATDTKPWWAVDKEGWKERLKIYVSAWDVVSKEKLKPWTDEDVKEFIASEPVYGPQLQALREAGNISLAAGAVMGAGTTAAVVRYGKSGTLGVVGFALGGVVGYLLGGEVATWTHGLYKFDNVKPNVEFLEWWRRKSA